MWPVSNELDNAAAVIREANTVTDAFLKGGPQLGAY